MTRTIDMTPTWPEALNMCRLLIENGTDEGKANAWAELERMAEIAQAHVDVQKQAAAVVNPVAYIIERTTDGGETEQFMAPGPLWVTDKAQAQQFTDEDTAHQLAEDFQDHADMKGNGYLFNLGEIAT